MVLDLLGMLQPFNSPCENKNNLSFQERKKNKFVNAFILVHNGPRQKGAQGKYAFH